MVVSALGMNESSKLLRVVFDYQYHGRNSRWEFGNYFYHSTSLNYMMYENGLSVLCNLCVM